MALAVGQVTASVALFTCTFTVLVTGAKSVASVGVNVTLSDCVPAPGAVLGVVKANEPETVALVIGETADPPVKLDEASV